MANMRGGGAQTGILGASNQFQNAGVVQGSQNAAISNINAAKMGQASDSQFKFKKMGASQATGPTQQSTQASSNGQFNVMRSLQGPGQSTSAGPVHEKHLYYNGY